jgi:cell division transport system permease protein
MKKRRKKTSRRKGMQVITLCISTTLVLILLGLMVMSMLTAHNLSCWVKENLTVTSMLSDTTTTAEAHRLCNNLANRPYPRSIFYISKEKALKEQSEAMGSDPSEFLGVNPFVATIEMQLNAEYANRDSITWIVQELKRHQAITDVAYQEDLMDKVNVNLRKISLILLALAVLMTIISFSLISNTVRLSVYSRRFTIHTMKLVGASWGFIRRPFVRQFVGIGVLASMLACIALGAAVYGLYSYEPDIQNVITTRDLIITGVAVFLFGILITTLCTYISVNRFLRMTAGELYKI